MYARKVFLIRRQAAGDPGFFKKLWGGVKKVGSIALKGASVVAPIVFPGVGGVATGAVSSLISSGTSRTKGMSASDTIVVGGALPKAGPLLRRAAVAGGRALLERAARGSSGRGLAVMPDFGGVQSGSSSTAPRVTFRRKYRRMNVTNMRALTRATRRVKRFAKIARACFSIDKRVRVKKGGRGRCH